MTATLAIAALSHFRIQRYQTVPPDRKACHCGERCSRRQRAFGKGPVLIVERIFLARRYPTQRGSGAIERDCQIALFVRAMADGNSSASTQPKFLRATASAGSAQADFADHASRQLPVRVGIRSFTPQHASRQYRFPQASVGRQRYGFRSGDKGDADMSYRRKLAVSLARDNVPHRR